MEVIRAVTNILILLFLGTLQGLSPLTALKVGVAGWLKKWEEIL